MWVFTSIEFGAQMDYLRILNNDDKFDFKITSSLAINWSTFGRLWRLFRCFCGASGGVLLDVNDRFWTANSYYFYTSMEKETTLHI